MGLQRSPLKKQGVAVQTATVPLNTLTPDEPTSLHLLCSPKLPEKPRTLVQRVPLVITEVTSLAQTRYQVPRGTLLLE